MTKVELKLYVEPETKEAIESIKENSQRTPEIWDMKTSEAGREVLNHGLEQLGENPDLEALVDEVDLEVWRKQKKYDKIRKEGRIIDMQGGWRGRVRSRLNGRLAGEEPFPPGKIISQADNYWREIVTWEDDEGLLAEHREWLDHQIEEYKRAYRAKEVYPEESFEAVDEKVAIGADLLRLKPQIVDVVETIERKASTKEWTGPDAIRDSIANEFGVDPEAIDVVLDYIVPEDVPVSRALMNGEAIREILPDEAIEQPDLEFSELESGQSHELKPDSWENKADDNVERAQLVIDDPDDLEAATESEINADVLEARIGGEDDE